MVPSTWKGGRRYMQIAYADAMAIARKFGNPTWFLTFTGNPNWPEVKAALKNGETIANRPDIVCRIFMDKAKELLKDLTERHVLGKVVAHMHSVEHQKRGIPHMHILLILEKDDRLSTPFVDEFISAEIPNLPMNDDHSEAAEQQRRLHQIITTNNIHDCNQHCLVDGVCAKRFPKAFSPNTVLDPGKKKYARRAPKMEEPLGRTDACPDNDDESDVNYQRRQFVPESGIPATDDVNKYGNVVQKEKNKIVTEYDNSRVVPYNAYLSLKYSCHINLEYVFDEKCCRYVFKYLMKGCDMAYVRVQKATRKKKADDDDECGDDDDLATLKPKDAYDEDEDAEYVYDEFDHTFCARYRKQLCASSRTRWCIYRIPSLCFQCTDRKERRLFSERDMRRMLLMRWPIQKSRRKACWKPSSTSASALFPKTPKMPRRMKRMHFGCKLHHWKESVNFLEHNVSKKKHSCVRL